MCPLYCKRGLDRVLYFKGNFRYFLHYDHCPVLYFITLYRFRKHGLKELLDLLLSCMHVCEVMTCYQISYWYKSISSVRYRFPNCQNECNTLYSADRMLLDCKAVYYCLDSCCAVGYKIYRDITICSYTESDSKTSVRDYLGWNKVYRWSYLIWV